MAPLNYQTGSCGNVLNEKGFRKTLDRKKIEIWFCRTLQLYEKQATIKVDVAAEIIRLGQQIFSV